MLEIRGRGNAWKVYYPSELRLASPVPVYDREGVLKEVLMCGSSNDVMTEAHFEGGREEALEFAGYLLPGSEVKVVRKLTPAQCLQKARKARAKS